MLVFLMLAGAVMTHSGIALLDQPIADGLHAAAIPPVTLLIRAITLLGAEGVWTLTILSSLFYLAHRKLLSSGIMLFALLSEEGLNYLLKSYFARPRPVFLDPLLTAGFYSFPSGHAMGSTVIYGMLCYLLVRQAASPRTRWGLVTGLTVLVMLIGFSRIYLGVHFFTDVLAGFAAGGVWLVVCISVVELVQRRQTGDEAA